MSSEHQINFPGATPSRKREHVELCVQEDVSFRHRRTGFDDLRFRHNALPEIDLASVDTSTEFLGRAMRAPLLISCMTGGYPEAEQINASLARAADRFGLAIGIGSGRQALESSAHHASFKVVRDRAPNAPVIANIGASEVRRLSQANTLSDLQKLIDLTGADALAIHLNPLQELMQPEGSPEFSGVLRAITEAIEVVQIPIIVKEVGAGISHDVGSRLVALGVRILDVAGAGGTSWAGVEILRHERSERSALEPFWDWGIPTVTSLLDLLPLKLERNITLIASGGIRHGVDIAKSIALGASIAGIARPMLTALSEQGEEGLNHFIENTLFQLRGAMFLTGSCDLRALAEQDLIAN